MIVEAKEVGGLSDISWDVSTQRIEVEFVFDDSFIFIEIIANKIETAHFSRNAVNLVKFDQNLKPLGNS
jgi:hypothetical protein